MTTQDGLEVFMFS